MATRPGTRLMHFLSSKGYPACIACEGLAAAMDSAGPAAILGDLDGWTDRMQASVELWRKANSGTWRAVARPPRFACRQLIEWACRVED